jgi:hypothetical protein
VHIDCAVVVDRIAAEGEGEKGLFNGGNHGKDTPGKHVGRLRTAAKHEKNLEKSIGRQDRRAAWSVCHLKIRGRSALKINLITNKIKPSSRQKTHFLF